MEFLLELNILDIHHIADIHKMGKKALQFKLFKENKKKYFSELEDFLSDKFKHNRYRHTLGVAHTSACLAMTYGADADLAYLAGLLHDIAKQLSEDDMLKEAKRYGLEVNDFEKNHPFILHGPVGACIAHEEFGIDNQEVIAAIRNHTTGRPDMCLLEKIVFIADYIEINRDQAENLDEIRKMAFDNIDDCLLKILKDTLVYLEKSGSDIDEKTLITANFYMK